MEHIAIMKKSWGLTEKILAGKKTVESRWYKARYAPWDRIKPGDTVYFKDSGDPVTIKANVIKVLQFDNLNSVEREQILAEYSKEDLGADGIMPEIRKYAANKNYCILVFFNKIEKIQPFEINKKGYGMMSSWITVDNVDKLKK